MAAPTKRRKVQGRLENFFVRNERLVCRGSIHQGDIETGGRQCTCIALVFLMCNDYPKTSDDIDHFLEKGTNLYQRICSNGGYMLITEFPEKVCIDNENYDLSVKDPKGGLVSQEHDNLESLTLKLDSAVEQSFAETRTCFFTMASDPGYTIGLKKLNTIFYVMDSHSRDDKGLCSPSGKAVVLKFDSAPQLVTYIKDLCRSVSANDLQYEMTPVTISKVSNSTEQNVDDLGEITDNFILSECDPACNSESTSNSILPESVNSELGESMDTPSHSNDQFEPTVTSSDSNDQFQPTFTSSHSNDQLQPTVPYDIGIVDVSTLTDTTKYTLICNRVPVSTFKFPTKEYKDSRCKAGFFKRSCCQEWFKKFKFIAYSTSQDGLYCLACKFFPDTSGRRPKQLVTEPYRNWKDATTDLKQHNMNEYHLNSMVRMEAFKISYTNPASRVDINLTSDNDAIIAKNRNVLKSLIKCLEFCGRRGMALRGHRDDDKTLSMNQGNFKELVKFRVEAGDSILDEHLANCKKHATYTSKTSQDDLLQIIKMYVQNKIVQEVRRQPFGPYFGYQCDEVTDTSNWEQLGLVLRYTVDGIPVERLLEFISAEEITGEALCDLIVKSLTDAGLDIQFCRAQTMDGAGNMSGKNIGCAATFRRLSPRALYPYCASHNLNLVLCKSCQVTEIHLMLDSLKQLGLFFKYSPKRSRKLEKAVDDINNNRADKDKITKAKFKVFCETRWTEKHTTLDSFVVMYEALLSCLESISTNEGRSWDRKAIIDATGLLTKITDSTFIMSFQTVHNFFGYMSGLSKKLQGSSLDIVAAYTMIASVKNVIESTRTDDEEYNIVYEKATKMADKAGIDSLSIPRSCGRQRNRNNVPASTPKEYFKRAIYLPFLDAIIQQLNIRFGEQTKSVIRALSLLPSNVNNTSEDVENDVFEYYKEDMPSPDSFRQELRLWKALWINQVEKPNTITSTITDSRSCATIFPNITMILNLLSLTSVTSSSTERANSSLKLIKTAMRSTMGEDRLNALMLLYVHRDIKLDYDKIIDDYASQNPRKMVPTNPLS